MNGKNVTAEQTQDIYIATLSCLQGLNVSSFLKAPSLVAFNVDGDLNEIYSLIRKNAPIPIGDFLRHLKEIKTEMYLLKNSTGGSMKGGFDGSG